MQKKMIILISVVLVTLVLCTQITLFVIQPIGALPEGKTLVILRLNNMNFIDSADAYCDRETGGVSLLCRAMTLAAVVKNSKILLRLPYSHFLYSISTNGKEYSK